MALCILKRCSIFPLFSKRLLSSNAKIDPKEFRLKNLSFIFPQAPPEVQLEIQEYGRIITRIEKFAYNRFPELMKDQKSAFKIWVDIILFMFSGLSRMQPLRRKTLMRDLLNVAKLLVTLAIFPILNFIFFGHKDPNPLQYDMEPEALKQALQRSWEMVHDRRGDDPIPPCPWVENIGKK